MTGVHRTLLIARLDTNANTSPAKAGGSELPLETGSIGHSLD
jgi:hypothetical protein